MLVEGEKRSSSGHTILSLQSSVTCDEALQMLLAKRSRRRPSCGIDTASSGVGVHRLSALRLAAAN